MGGIAVELSMRSHALLSLRESQARDVKSIKYGWERRRLLGSFHCLMLWPSCLQHLLWFGGEEGTTLRGV